MVGELGCFREEAWLKMGLEGYVRFEQWKEERKACQQGIEAKLTEGHTGED